MIKFLKKSSPWSLLILAVFIGVIVYAIFFGGKQDDVKADNTIVIIKDTQFDKDVSIYLREGFNSMTVQNQKLKVQRMYFYTCEEIFTFCQNQPDWTGLTGCNFCWKQHWNTSKVMDVSNIYGVQ